ncbi:DctP family TRAP transporter solute-binding subunit [Neobacillus mesonae]|uniref:DctP family TRAP transporter solute-binding subunit n=1 Tax=Neobacillus mesonae TaxID=1193713 RepID=UPI0020408F27|nr:DctP family TRAP transporter solute-binding subunit [Neobacillus mesonae]MCM3567593.1 DctP family TRAP transporter solute-binding subunit [Neobacillus mesonae]
MKKKFGILVVLLVLIFSLAACSGGESKEAGGSASNSGNEIQKITIKFSHVGYKGAPKTAGADKFKEILEEKSGGKIKVEVYPAGQLYGDREEMDALLANNVQIIMPSMTKLVVYNPQFQILDIPFLFKTREGFFDFWDNGKGKEMFSTLEDKGIVTLGLWEGGFKQLVNNRNPIKKPGDLKGLKFRIQAGDVLEKQFKVLGADASVIPYNETYTALQTGVVDSTENMLANIYSSKYQEVLKYLTISNHGRLDYPVITNTTFWNGLNDATKKVIQEAMDEATKYEREEAQKMSEDYLKQLSKVMKVNELTEEEKNVFIKQLQPLYDEFESVIGKDYMDAARGK